MKNNDNAAMYANTITIAEENRVRGFDPLRFLEMTANGPKLALKIKQTWFRMKYPEGRIILRALNLTEKLALIEARVFLHKSDSAPQYTSQVQRMLNEVPGGLFVQAAQNAAVEQVLDEAGFTIRFNGAPVTAQVQTPVTSNPVKTVQPPNVQKTVTPVKEEPIVNETPVQMKPEPQSVTQTVPAPKLTVNEQPVVQQIIVTPPVAESPIEESPAAPMEETKSVEAVKTQAVEEVVPTPIVKEESKEETIPVSVAEAAPIVEPVSAPVLESIPIPPAEASAAQTSGDALPYTANTPVEEIIKQMSVDDALNYVVTSGSCKGWTMAQALAKRPASVRFYTTPGYKGDDNILRASAAIVLKDLERLAKAS